MKGKEKSLPQERGWGSGCIYRYIYRLAREHKSWMDWWICVLSVPTGNGTCGKNGERKTVTFVVAHVLQMGTASKVVHACRTSTTKLSSDFQLLLCLRTVLSPGKTDVPQRDTLHITNSVRATVYRIATSSHHSLFLRQSSTADT